MKHANKKMLLRIGQADAYAMACEYSPRSPEDPEYHALRAFTRYVAHPTYREVSAGSYTDDTQMSIAVSEALLDEAGNARAPGELTEEHFVKFFFEAYARDPRPGYSHKLQEIFQQAKDPVHLRALMRPDSTKNGAAMRAVPLGVLPAPTLLLKVATAQASVTHATWGGVQSACAVALMSHYALYHEGDFSEMFSWCLERLPSFSHFENPWRGPVDSEHSKEIGLGMATAWAVCTLLQEQRSLLSMMRQILDWGGDTDSVAAISWGIASCRYADEALPSFFESELEKGRAYGPAFLQDLGDRLMRAYA